MSKLVLSQQWRLCYAGVPQSKDEEAEYRKCFKSIGDFTSVQDFTEKFQFVERPSALPQKTGYCLMKNTILPMYEDEAHDNNGASRVRLTTGSPDQNDILWEKLVVGVLTGLFSHPSFTGIETRKNDRGEFCAVWMIGKQQVQDEGMKMLKEFLGVPEGFALSIQRQK
ncbi:Translation_elongation factor [Hexamita inflata]|uniref:Translation elongation factor n=1 Tax=Hexamita inflata TaxID=28002 RepID=A0AA86QXK2_9EUKA|nr:Translation elongation factor [Hexamita inflata]CAI9967876.1 Translation elongation factor [Hexamita inflata]CAI9974895.1 Translation elongation factor [Hexamita inflata]